MLENMNTWKETLLSLQEGCQKNEAVIEEVRKEIEAQEERNRQAVRGMADRLKAQIASLEDLLKTVQSDSLYLVPADHSDRDSYIDSLHQALTRSEELLASTLSLLDEKESAAPAKPEEEAKQAREEPVIPPFPQSALLGNWIHYFQKDMYTCQCFWADGEFKEYDFKDRRLIEERSGSYRIDDHDVLMTYSNGKKAVYTVTGFSVDCLDYLIDDTAIRFDYMPEDLLNSLLEENADRLGRI